MSAVAVEQELQHILVQESAKKMSTYVSSSQRTSMLGLDSENPPISVTQLPSPITSLNPTEKFSTLLSSPLDPYGEPQSPNIPLFPGINEYYI